MREMLINNRDIAEYGARLLTYTVGGTELTRVTSTSYNAAFPKMFHSDYGQRKINITLVFKPKYHDFGGVVAKLHSLAMQKSAFDAVMCKGTVDIWLPDNYYYNCVLESIGDEVTDGESLEVTYTLSGIRHLKLAKIKGDNIYCSSTVNTDCRLTLTASENYGSNVGCILIMSDDKQQNQRSMNIKNLSSGDVVVIDGINKTVTKNGNNYFSKTDFVTFPYLTPGKNVVEKFTADVTIMTEYYPTLI
ncbi:MAG: hypothetical protein PUG48_10715 [Clostridia bacterium]|nr:hypothetical protein [Clostridia bacterium]